ncbi:MAG: amino acid ABC transporter permease, partial [Alphaproteobacteria bacterium]|nr:amino acid ABC transporter permease [Alphaproteobacteria bacterium]
LATVLWWLFGVTVFDDTLSAVLAVDLDSVESARLGGFLLSTIIGVSGIVGSLPVGIVLALGRQSNLLIIKGCCVGFIEFIRGVPLITLLFVAWLLLAYFLPPGTEFDLILRVVIMVTAFASAYMAEVIRGGLAALPVGQYEAADSLGLDYWKSMQLIILPQALKVSIPGIVNTFIGLFKDTTLVIVIGLLDPVGLLQPIRADQNWNGIVWELYGFIALFFFIFCFAMSRYSMHLERNLDVGHR